MRATALIGLLLWAPSIASAQQDQAIVNRVLGNVPELVISVVDPELPAGTIAVKVIDPAGAAVPQQAVRLGVMEQSGGRESEACVTDDEGACVFDALLTDSKHSYRVNVPYEGARYSSTPFRLDAAKGQRVRVVRLPTTTEDRRIFQVLGRTMIEFRDDRAHISQEARLANLGESTYVFPNGGMSIRLPDGFKAFESMAVMTDQRLAATDDGLEISGSLPPGRADLRWTYDIPVGGTSMSIQQAVPFATMEYQVISDYVDGMTMEVEGFQVARVHEGGDRRFLVAGLMRRPGDAPLDPLRIHIRGIPGGGPLPFLAAAIAAIFVVLGIGLLFRPVDQTLVLARVRDDRRAELLDEIASLEGERKADAIGPSYYEQRRRELTDELAIVLRMQSEATGH
ncbi:MAG: carboxypeptidase regulatory-like domain-containing protein [Myxococcales bacterium]|nr:MAG: carboxypeptidase regulatory-like domain-containing protein [Myxococcales bacterium]